MRTRYTKADREPTWTSKITKALREADDFLNLVQIRAATGASTSQATAALHHLKHSAHVVDSIESGGVLWWFLTGGDDRSRTIEERAREAKGNRAGRAKPQSK